MTEEAFGWVKYIGTLPHLMARGLDNIRACAAQLPRIKNDAIRQFAGAVVRWRLRAIRSGG